MHGSSGSFYKGPAMDDGLELRGGPYDGLRVSFSNGKYPGEMFLSRPSSPVDEREYPEGQESRPVGKITMVPGPFPRYLYQLNCGWEFMEKAAPEWHYELTHVDGKDVTGGPEFIKDDQ
jgi:hypothetical protein